MTVIGMSQPEINRLHLLQDVVAEQMTVREAALRRYAVVSSATGSCRRCGKLRYWR